MTGRVRTRDNSHSLSGRKYRIYIGWQTRSATVVDSKITTDEVGKRWMDNPFTSDHVVATGPLLNGTLYSGATLLKAYEDTPITGWPITGPSVGAHLQLTGVDIQRAVFGAVLRSSPNKEHISVPTWLGELRDIPDMVRAFHSPRLMGFLAKGGLKRALQGKVVGDFFRHPFGRSWQPGLKNLVGAQIDSSLPRAARAAKSIAGGVPHLPRKAAEANLWWRFGLAPFLSDLAKLASFVDAVERRLALLRRLRDKGSYRKHVNLGNESFALPVTPVTLESELAMITGTYQDNWFARRWVSVQWTVTPGSVGLPEGDSELLSMAQRSLSGMSVAGLLKTAWELKPWSWLVDWFYNIGDLIDSCKNTVPVCVKDACFMQNTLATRVYKCISRPEWVSITFPDGEYAYQTERKYRLPVAGLVATLPPLPALPVILAGQWQILASLAACRARIPRDHG